MLAKCEPPGKPEHAINAKRTQSLLRDIIAISRQIRELRRELAAEFGTASRLATALLGPLLLWTSHREEQRLADAFFSNLLV